MSLTAAILAFASGLAAKVRLPPDPRDAKVRLPTPMPTPPAWDGQAEIDRLDRELALERNLRLHWQGEAQRLAFRANHEINGRNAMMAAQQQAYAAQQAYHAQQNQQQSNFQALGQLAAQQLAQLNVGGEPYQQGLLGAQSLDNASWRDWACTCIPDRASLIIGRVP
jgi:hypothetical protein